MSVYMRKSMLLALGVIVAMVALPLWVSISLLVIALIVSIKSPRPEQKDLDEIKRINELNEQELSQSAGQSDIDFTGLSVFDPLK